MNQLKRSSNMFSCQRYIRVERHRINYDWRSSVSDLISWDKSHSTIQAGCALRVRKYTMVLEQCRKLMIHHQFNNEPFRILLAAFASGLSPTDQFINPSLQKYLLREMRLAHAAVKGNVQWYPSTRRYILASSTKQVEDAEDEDDLAAPEDAECEQADKYAIPKKPTKNNPVLVALHGQIMGASRNYQGALCTTSVLNSVRILLTGLS